MRKYDQHVKPQGPKYYAVFGDEHALGNSAAVYFQDVPPTQKQIQASRSEDGLGAHVYVWCEDELFFCNAYSSGKLIEFCGHGTLAAAAEMYFQCQSADIIERADHIEMRVRVGSKDVGLRYLGEEQFAFSISALHLGHIDALSEYGIEGVSNCYHGNGVDVMMLKNVEDVYSAAPNFDWMRKNQRYLGIFAQLGSSEIAVRYFAPSSGKNEDQATGSFFALITPLCSQILNLESFTMHQLSENGGRAVCRKLGGRVEIQGRVRAIANANEQI